MREAERREAAAIEYATAVENKRKQDQERFNKVDSDYTAKFEESVKSGMDMAQQKLASAIEAGDATAQVEANKKIAELAFENAKLQQRKEANQLNRKHLLNCQTVDNYQIKPHNKCLKLILWLKIGLQKIDGSEQIEL